MQAIHIILFIVYGCLLSLAVLRMPFLKRSHLKPGILVMLFWLKVAVGCVHNFVAWRLYPNHGDIWQYFQKSLTLKADLLHQPLTFIATHFSDYSSLHFTDTASVWGHLQYLLLCDINVFLDFLSFDNFYINTLFFSFAVFPGSIALYRLFLKVFPGSMLAACLTLIIPSTIFWTACIHKEGVLYFLSGFLFWHWHQLLNRFSTGRLLLCLLFLAGIFFIRNSFIAGLLPALALWTLASKTSWKKSTSVFIVAGSVVAVLLIAGTMHERYNIFSVFSNRQSEYYEQEGGSRILLPALTPEPASFLEALPYALLNGFLQPLPGKGGQAVYTVFSIELICIWLVIIAAIAARLYTKRTQPVPAFALLCLALCCINLLIMGYLVPFAGAIVRYRSIFLPFMLAPFIYDLRTHPFFSKAERRVSARICKKADTAA